MVQEICRLKESLINHLVHFERLQSIFEKLNTMNGNILLISCLLNILDYFQVTIEHVNFFVQKVKFSTEPCVQRTHLQILSNIIMCPLQALSTMDKGQHGHSDRCAATQPCTQQDEMHCVFWHLSILVSMNFFRNLCNSSASVGSDQTGQASLPIFISEP